LKFESPPSPTTACANAEDGEAAIALAKNQFVAYAGMATIYGLVGKRTEARS
jgi:hypothetical protein